MKDFISNLKNKWLSKDDPQEKCGRGENIWTADMWTLGVAECLDIGLEKYTPTERMFKLYYKDLIWASKLKRSMIEHLKSIQEEADCIFVCEVGRGLDILLAESIRKWDKVYCYDNVNYGTFLKEYFGDHIIFTQCPGSNFHVSQLKDDCIMLFNSNTNTKVSTLVEKMGQDIYRYIDNDKIKKIILNGEIIK